MRDFCDEPGKFRLSPECVVDLRGLELRAIHAVTRQPVSEALTENAPSRPKVEISARPYGALPSLN